MKLETTQFGEIDIDDDMVIDFDNGLPGFPDDKRFVLLDGAKDFGENESCPFLWMQSVVSGDVAFILMDVFAVLPDYKPILSIPEFSELGVYDDENKEDFLIYNIVVIPEEGIKHMSVNLAAPVVINQNLRKGKQIIANNSEYNIRHYLFQNISAG